MGDRVKAWGAVAVVLTVTFFRKKPGHLLLPCRRSAARFTVTAYWHAAGPFWMDYARYFENDPALWLADLPAKQQREQYSRGHGLDLRGLPYTGAARMAARATARAGSD